MKKITLFLLTAVLVAVSTMFFGCKTDGDDPPATYSKYDRYKFASEAAFNSARGNHSLITTTGTLDGSANKPISPVKTYSEYVQSLKDEDAAADNYELSKWDTSTEPYVFFFSDTSLIDSYLVDVLGN